MEVIVSAAVLALMALAVLTGLDGAGHASARERARSQASALAEQDQERLRSMSFESLVDGKVPQTGAVKVGDSTYTVTSEANWNTDDNGGEPACGDKSYRATEYVKLITTVTSNIVGVRMQPIRVESLLSSTVDRAQGNGTLTVRVNSGKVSRAADLAVTINGPKSDTERTNSDGCALFRSIPIGNYTISLNTDGYVDKKGSKYTETTAIVNPNVVTASSLAYDRAVNMNVDVKTIKPGDTFSTTATSRPSKANAVSDNAADAGTLRTYTPNPVGATSNIKPQNVYPFDSAYSYFAGACAYESPTKASASVPDYFNTTNALAAVKGDPEAFQPQSATVFQPALNLRVRAASANNAPTNFDATTTKLELFMTLPPASGDTCTDITNLKMKLATWPTATWGTQPAGATAATGFVWQTGASTEFDPGLPFGTYALCLRDNISATATPNYRYWTSTYNNTSPSGRAATMEIPPTGTLTAPLAWTTTKPATCP